MRFLWVFCCPFFLFGSISGDLKVGLRALQQIRTLIPERLSEEEFSILVEWTAFQEPLEQLAANALKAPGIPSAKELGCSRFYYSHWTLSGEPIRILDSYQEFEYGPYWLYPTAMERLWEIDYPTTPRNR